VTTPRAEFFGGVRAQLPILLGVAPFGMIYGVAAVHAGLSPLAAQAMSAIVFAGSAQFVAVQLIAAGTPPLLVVLTVFVLNLRHLLYSASIAPFLQHLPRRGKALLAYLLTDEAYVVAILHFERSAPSAAGPWYLAGTGAALWATWQASSAAGIFLGGQVPAAWSLDFALPLTFIALLVPGLAGRGPIVAALAGGSAALLGAGLPYNLGLIAATLVGLVAGTLAEGRPGATEAAP